MTMPSARYNEGSAIGETHEGDSAAETGPGSAERPSSGALLMNSPVDGDTSTQVDRVEPTSPAASEHSVSSEEAFAESSRLALRARSHTRRLGLPYVGLRHFSERDHEFFFGRDEELRRLRNMLDEGRLAAVVGPRKSGRTSLLEAGLAGQLRASNDNSYRPWLIGRFDLGSSTRDVRQALKNVFWELTQDPQLLELDGRSGSQANAERAGLVFASLDDASDAIARATQHLLAGTGARLLLIIDNFENLTRQPERSAQAFVSQLLEATGRNRGHAGFHVALAIRDAELGSCGQFAGLGSALAGRTLVLERPSAAQFEQIIREPARVANWSVSRALVAQLLQDCATWPYPMAELQHALEQMSGHAVASGKLDLTSYAAVGCPNAIARQAEHLFAGDPESGATGLRESERLLAERVFTHLVDCRSGAAVARRLTLAQLAQGVDVSATDESLRALLRTFSSGTCGFLRWYDAESTEVAPNDPDTTLVELGHALLIERWPRFEAWVARDLAQGRTFRELLAAAAAERDGSAGLLRGPQLAQAQAWWSEVTPTSHWAQRHCSAGIEPASLVAGAVTSGAVTSGAVAEDSAASDIRAQRRRGASGSERNNSGAARYQIDPIELVQQYLQRSADEEQAALRRLETEQAAQQAQARHAKRRLTFVVGLAALVTLVGGVVLFGVSRERDEALGESELLAQQNAAKDTLNGRLLASEAELRRSLDDTRREIESLIAQLDLAENELAQLESSNETLDQALSNLEQRYKEIVRAHDAALLDAKASRDALAAVRVELAAARAQVQQAQSPQAPQVQAQEPSGPAAVAPRITPPPRELAPFPSAVQKAPGEQAPAAPRLAPAAEPPGAGVNAEH